MADEHRGNGATSDAEHESGRNVRAGYGGASAAVDAHHGLSHVTPVRLLVAIWGILMVMTALTVAATYVDLGGRMNLIVAMVIATVKAGLVVTYFMHLRWDRPFNTLIFLGSLLFVSLFISMTLLDKSEYEKDIQDMYILKGQ